MALNVELNATPTCSGGFVEDVATIFLANRECPFRCLMCDLWKYTTEQRVPDGAIVAQLEWALARLPPVRHLKLYNAGNFFDAQAIPPGEMPTIAERLAHLETLIVECHPRLVGRRCVEFQDVLKRHSRSRRADTLRASPTGHTLFQVAMGLETVHPDVLPRLNKRMSLADFERAVRLLRAHDIAVRAFILLQPPFLDEAEGLHWACCSVEWAFSVGVECCVLIPTRTGNGAMEWLEKQGQFAPPRLASLEAALEHGIGMHAGRVFADLWDIEKFYTCLRCGPARAERLRKMNLIQKIVSPVRCEQCKACHDS